MSEPLDDFPPESIEYKQMAALADSYRLLLQREAARANYLQIQLNNSKLRTELTIAESEVNMLASEVESLKRQLDAAAQGLENAMEIINKHVKPTGEVKRTV